MKTKRCEHCGLEYSYHRSTSRFCSQICGAAFRWAKQPKVTDRGRTCIVCGAWMALRRDQSQKKTCSAKCRRARVAQITREWHKRNPERESLYRQRTKAKQGPESNLLRFRRTNPNAPMACEACGELRVLDVAHKPGKERNGAWRSATNCVWPEMVWVLCPTCHALIDRMHYPPAEFGLTQ